MPSFDDAIVADAPPEEVWKLLYDPTRFPDWMEGVAQTADRSADAAAGTTTFTQFADGYPDFPMPQRMSSAREGSRVVISCLVSDIEFRWTLAEAPGGSTSVAVHIEIPDAEAARLDAQRTAVGASLQNLAALAAGAAR